MKLKIGDVVELKITRELQVVIDVPSSDRIDIRPLGTDKGKVGIPNYWVKRVVTEIK